MQRALCFVLLVLLGGCGHDDASKKRVAQGGAGTSGESGQAGETGQGGTSAQGGASAQSGQAGQGGEAAQVGEAGEGGEGGIADPGGCPPLDGDGTMHGGSVTEDETWTASDSPHFLPFDTSVYATLTLEPCAVVRVSAENGITVRAGGSVIAEGVAEQPVLIEPDGDVNWYGLTLLGGTAHLSHTRIVGAGSPQNGVPDRRGAVDMVASVDDLTGPDPVLFVDNVSIEDSASQGFVAHGGGGFHPDSRALTVTGSQGHAGTMHPNLLETLPEGSYTGNGIDAIMLPDDLPGQIFWDVTIHDRGVPYYSGGTNQAGWASVGTQDSTNGLVVLTIEPGVVWRFKKEGLLNIDPSEPSTGVLIARGTEEKPIIFTSDEENPAAGDWLGIRIGGDDPRNKLDWVTIEYAGMLVPGAGSGSCQSLTDGIELHNGASLRVYLVPSLTLVTNSTFFQSTTNGIDRGWRDDEMPSLLANNVFTGIRLCNETFPRDDAGECPEPPPCPKTP